LISYEKPNITNNLEETTGDSRVSEKKVVSRNIALGLGILCIILAVTTFAAAFDVIPIPTSKDTEIGNLKMPNLVNVGLGAADEGAQPPYDNPVLRIRGYVVNTGTDTAYNAKLHVIAYFVSGAKAIDTSVTIGNGVIRGQDSVRIDTTVPYASSNSTVYGLIAAASATLTPEWTDSP
jgi:hypothetical protein